MLALVRTLPSFGTLRRFKLGASFLSPALRVQESLYGVAVAKKTEERFLGLKTVSPRNDSIKGHLS